MKKLTVLLFLSGSVMANQGQQAQQVNMMLSAMERMGALERLSQCIDLPVGGVKDVLRKTYIECGLGDMMAEEPDPQHIACMEKAMAKHSGIPVKRWQACEDDSEEGDDPLLAELDALSERIGERDPTEAELRQMDELTQRLQQRGVAEMQQMVDAMIDGSQGSDASITLPIFPQAKMLINMPARGQVEIGQASYAGLPGASFLSKASPQEVLEFYRQQLPKFKELKANKDVALMQSIPPGFDYSRDLGRAFSIPHIYIQPASDTDRQRLAGAKTLFFIYYQPND